MEKPTVKQSIFYVIIFLTGLMYQPNWIYENFWSQAGFYDSLPFDFPYLGFLIIYSSLLTAFMVFIVKMVKKFL